MTKNKNLPEFGPLSGVRVVHCTQSTAGPFGVQLLADYGADVLWLENALAPDISRTSGQYAPEAERRNQRNLALNIPTDEGKKIFLQTIKDADIFIETSKGGQWAKWGLSDEVLWEVNPRLVICHISGFGQQGIPEYVKRPSYDAIAQAFGGLTAANRNPVTDPYPVGPYMADYMTAFFVPISCLAAYIKTQQTGIGESIDLAQYEVVARCQQYQPDWFTAHRKIENAGDPSFMSGWGCYECKDGAYLQCCLIGGGVLKKAIPFLGLEYGQDPFPTGIALAKRAEESGKQFEKALANYLSAKTCDEAQAEMLAAGLPVQKINELEDLENDPHVQERNLIEEITNFKGEKIRYIGIVPKFEKNPGKTWRPAPWIGMDNEEVLKELGYSREEIRDLYEKKIISHDDEMRWTMPYDK